MEPDVIDDFPDSSRSEVRTIEKSVPSSSSDAPPPGKFACFCVFNVHAYEWFAFDISDDIEHNQHPPPLKYIAYPIPFHEDDENGAVNIEPKTTAKMDWLLGWAILGLEKLYVIDDWSGAWRGPSVWNEGNRVDRIDLMSPGANWERLPQIPNQIAGSAHTFVLGSKFYCLGGFPSKNGLEIHYLNHDFSVTRLDSLPPPPCLDIDKILSRAKEVPKPCLPPQNMESPPWAMAYDHSLNKWESLPDPPIRPVKVDSIFSAAIEVPNPCVVVGLPEDGLIQIYDVNIKTWETKKFEICPEFGPKVLKGPTLAVDSKLFWYSVDNQCMVGYDLVKEIWFVGSLPIHDHGKHFGEQNVDTPPRLAHLGHDKFCLLWVSVLPSWRMSECKSRFHCMKLRVTIRNPHPEGGIIPLTVSILSCHSYLASGPKFFRGGLVVEK